MIKEFFTITKYIYPKPTLIFMEKLPLDEPIVFVANHEKNYGPSVMQLFFPITYHPWIIDRMLEVSDCRQYIQEAFFIERLGWPVWLSRASAFTLAPILVSLMKMTKPVPVYRDNPKRIVETFRQSMSVLENGGNLLIFPENPNAPDYSEEIKEFFDGFLYVAKLYQLRTGKGLLFCPVSINPKQQFITIGKMIRFNPETDFQVESNRVRKHLMSQVAGLYHTPWFSGGPLRAQELSKPATDLSPNPT